jgi:hypothetical protein
MGEGEPGDSVLTPGPGIASSSSGGSEAFDDGGVGEAAGSAVAGVASAGQRNEASISGAAAFSRALYSD